MNRILTKSDFVAGISCPQKLLYRKRGLPQAAEGADFQKMLAEGGFLIGKLAQILFPDGIEVTGSTTVALEASSALFERENIILFEPAFQHGQMFARADIVVKKGTSVQVIEVKSKTFDSGSGFKEKDFTDIMDDLAFQAMVISSAFPHWQLTCHFLLPDKAKRNRIPDLPSWFQFEADATGGRNPMLIVAESDNELAKRLKMIRDNSFLTMVDVTELVGKRKLEVEAQALSLINIMNAGTDIEPPPIGWGCKSCEYRVEGPQPSGFECCWGEMASSDTHLFDLFKGSLLKLPSGESVAEVLFSDGKSSFLEIDFGGLGIPSDKPTAKRQKLQIDHTRSCTEWISPQLPELLSSLRYPLHFIDFETFSGPVPFHAGMRPGDVVAFQWSCHTVTCPGEPPTHKGWLHTTADLPDGSCFPNFEFAASLKHHIGREGTLLCWGAHEKAILAQIRDQMDEMGWESPELREWLGFASGEGGDNPWIDLNKLALTHYFHPEMKGSTSIKKVLPAIWNAHPWLHLLEPFRQFAPAENEESPYDPYSKLRSLGDTDLDDETVDGGTDAMRAYQSLRFERGMSSNRRAELQNQLWEYCKLDTLAMVMIFTRWARK